ncbi:uncharacterized protein LOC116575952 [Mustela erminea]|uniref:uncharacterized protein LOC116575952 n=1 Tax=Mustela erminea TaxID=36723 RepID=UPI001386C5F8|nr:uncharacterized protein LOC116575952 [Mustela erminea]
MAAREADGDGRWDSLAADRGSEGASEGGPASVRKSGCYGHTGFSGAAGKEKPPPYGERLPQSLLAQGSGPSHLPRRAGPGALAWEAWSTCGILKGVDTEKGGDPALPSGGAWSHGGGSVAAQSGTAQSIVIPNEHCHQYEYPHVDSWSSSCLFAACWILISSPRRPAMAPARLPCPASLAGTMPELPQPDRERAAWFHPACTVPLPSRLCPFCTSLLMGLQETDWNGFCVHTPGINERSRQSGWGTVQTASRTFRRYSGEAPGTVPCLQTVTV